MIYYDPTEARSNTRLPEPVISAGHPLPALEAATGADLLITMEPVGDISALANAELDDLQFITSHFREYPDSVFSNIASVRDTPIPVVIAAKRLLTSCESGLLVQRKTGSDLLSLIPNYGRILMKMLTWTNQPWLLFVGQFKCSKDDKVVIDGRKARFNYSSLTGCLEAWQMGYQGYGGGFFTQLSRDSLVAPWIDRWLNKLREGEKEHMIPARAGIRPVIGEKRPWVQTLTTFPGIGPGRAKELADHWGSLSACIEYLSDNDEWKREKVAGIGQGTVMSARLHLGFEGEKGLRMVVEMKGGE